MAELSWHLAQMSRLMTQPVPRWADAPQAGLRIRCVTHQHACAHTLKRAHAAADISGHEWVFPDSCPCRSVHPWLRGSNNKELREWEEKRFLFKDMTICAKRDVCFACVTYAHAHFFHVDAYIVSFFFCAKSYIFLQRHTCRTAVLCAERTQCGRMKVRTDAEPEHIVIQAWPTRRNSIRAHTTAVW